MSTKKDKLKRVKELQEQIEKIWNEPVDDNYELVAVTPDGGGVRDDTKVVAIGKDKDKLIDYCEKTYSYTPVLSDTKVASTNKNVWETWYLMRISEVVIVT